jgi:hypothetical protein
VAGSAFDPGFEAAQVNLLMGEGAVVHEQCHEVVGCFFLPYRDASVAVTVMMSSGPQEKMSQIAAMTCSATRSGFWLTMR